METQPIPTHNQITIFEAIQIIATHLRHMVTLNEIALQLLKKDIAWLESLPVNPDAEGLSDDELEKLKDSLTHEAPSLPEAMSYLEKLLGKETMDRVLKYMEASQIVFQAYKDFFGPGDYIVIKKTALALRDNQGQVNAAIDSPERIERRGRPRKF